MTAPRAATTDDAFLGGALKLLQPRTGFRAGIDAVLLAASVPDAGDGRVVALDAGAGVGTAGLCLARRCPGARVTLAERDATLAGLARDNVVRNDLSARVTVAEGNLIGKAAEAQEGGLPASVFDVVLSNPPWLEDGQGRASADPVRARANAMPAGDLDRWLRALARAAAPGALLVMIHRADALARLLQAVDGRFGGIEILPLHAHEGDAANRILVRGRKGSRAPLGLLPGIVLHRAGGGFVPAIEDVLRHGAPLDWLARP